MFNKKLEATRPTAVVEHHSFGAHWQNALRLSMTRALSVFACLLAIGAAWATGAAYTEFGEPWVLLVGALFVAPTVAFGIGLWRNTDRVQEKLWAAETRDGQDYDGDKVVGKPKKEPRFINVAGVPIPFDDDDEDDEVSVLLTGFNASKAVVLAFFTEASVRGLTRTSLVTKPNIMLDEMIPLSKPVWDHFTTQAEINGWITTDGPGTSYRWVVKADAVLKAIRDAK